MNAESHRPKDVVPALSAAIGALDLAEKNSTIVPAKAVFASVSALLTTIRDSMANQADHVELGLLCADVCRALDRGTSGKKQDELTRLVYDAITQLTLIVADIRRKLVKWDQRNAITRRFRAKNDKETITTWGLDLNKVLQVLKKELAANRDATGSTIHHEVVNTHTVVSGTRDDVANSTIVTSDSHRNASKKPGDVGGQDRMDHASAPDESQPPPPRRTVGTISDIRHDMKAARTVVSDLEHNVTTIQTMVSDMHGAIVKDQEGSGGKNLSIQASTLGESPPPAPRACFGRDGVVEKVISLAENLTPTALIGGGGIGKTSIALTVLHHDCIRRRFGHNRRFIRCDQFPATLPHFLSRLSKAIGAGVENPEDMTPLRPFLSSQEMFIVLDNAESILDPRGANGQEIYAVMEELSQFPTICLCVTSRITNVPRHCKRPTIPTLSMEAASGIFYDIYDSGGRSEVISDLLRQLDFHALSITLLATTASHNMWDFDRLAQEWDARRTEVLRTDYNESLAATIELSLASPTFGKLGPDTRDLLGVVAFFPQGIDEDNLDWLFPTISERKKIFDKFCVLSLTHRSNGFITMLAPLRDYLCPKDPKSSSLLCTTKDRYFARLSVHVDPGYPGFDEARWIKSEDVNVEHLFDIFTSIDPNSAGVWDACAYFMRHLYWHKTRLVVLGPKIERLPDDHDSKPECLFQLSRLFNSVGNRVEYRRLLIWTLKLWRERGDDIQVAETLMFLANANRLLDLRDEGIQRAKEALKIYERLGDVGEQAQCLTALAWLLYDGEQLDAAEEVASRAIDLLPEKCEEYTVCRSHDVLGNIHRLKGNRGKAIHHFEVALGIASSFNWHNLLFWIHYSLAMLFRDEGEFDDAHAHVEQAKSHTDDSVYTLGRAMELQASIWYNQDRLEEARSKILWAADVFEKLGAAKDVEDCRKLLRDIQEDQGSPVASDQSRFYSQQTE